MEDFVPRLSDPGIAIGGALLLFLIPTGRGEFALNWQTATRLPWGVLILFGGGLSLAQAIQSTKLAVWTGDSLAWIGAWPILPVVLIVVTVIVFLTELTSNTATTAAFLPVVASLSMAMGVEPMILTVPAAISASCAFMMPVATPPNAIVYGSGHIATTHMLRAGFFLNLIFIALVTAAALLLAPPFLG